MLSLENDQKMFVVLFLHMSTYYIMHIIHTATVVYTTEDLLTSQLSQDVDVILTTSKGKTLLTIAENVSDCVQIISKTTVKDDKIYTSQFCSN